MVAAKITRFFFGFICLLPLIESSRNVLFIAIDDLRPEIAAYDGTDPPPNLFPFVLTPNIDNLASDSLVLKRAYTQYAICNPSRASMLTGRRPDTTHVYNLQDYFRIVGGNFTTIPQYFKENGYVSLGFGKHFHPGDSNNDNDPLSWTEPNYIPTASLDVWNTREVTYRAATDEEQAVMPLPDDFVLEEAVNALRKFGAGGEQEGQPFYIAVGFYKPHLPFTIPEEYLDFYPEEEMYLPDNPYAPFGMPEIAWNPWTEILNYEDIAAMNHTGAMNETMADDVTLALRRHYLACVTYVDALVGELLGEVEQLGLGEDTVVVLWGDHGYLLGEHGGWGKHMNLELATHVPMVVKVPGLTVGAGLVSSLPTESVDLFPTLVEAAQLPPVPVCPEDSADVAVCHEGSTLLPLMDPGECPEWKSAAFSQFLREGVMGYSVKTARFQYTEWPSFSGAPDYEPDWEELHGRELYDHDVDPTENHNVVDDPAYEDVVEELSDTLRAGWRNVPPVECRRS